MSFRVYSTTVLYAAKAGATVAVVFSDGDARKVVPECHGDTVVGQYENAKRVFGRLPNPCIASPDLDSGSLSEPTTNEPLPEAGPVDAGANADGNADADAPLTDGAPRDAPAESTGGG